MKKLTVTCAMASVVWMGTMALAAPTVNVGTKFLAPNTANQKFRIDVTGNDPVQAVNLFAQIGDGVAAGPDFTAATLTAPGLVFTPSNTGNSFLSVQSKQLSVATTTTGTFNPATGANDPTFVPATGDFAEITISTLGINTRGASYELKIDSPGPTEFINTDVIPTTRQNGTLKITIDGDADLDGLAGFGDLGILLANYDQSGAWAQANFDFDPIVGFGDLGLLLANYNSSALDLSSPSISLGATAVPEPSTWVLLTVGGACGWLIRRARRGR